MSEIRELTVREIDEASGGPIVVGFLAVVGAVVAVAAATAGAAKLGHELRQL